MTWEFSGLARVSKRARALEVTRGRSVEELLRELYYRDGLTLAEISDVLNVPVSTVGGWMVRLGINQRRLAGLAGLGVEKAS